VCRRSRRIRRATFLLFELDTSPRAYTPEVPSETSSPSLSLSLSLVGLTIAGRSIARDRPIHLDESKRKRRIRRNASASEKVKRRQDVTGSPDKLYREGCRDHRLRCSANRMKEDQDHPEGELCQSTCLFLSPHRRKEYQRRKQSWCDEDCNVVSEEFSAYLDETRRMLKLG